MPEITIPVGRNIGPSYIDWESWEYMEGFTVDDIRRHLQFAEYDGIQVDGILLQFGICYGGLTSHAMEIYNFLRGLGIPVRAHVLSVTASAGTIVALSADEVTLEHTAQWMVHRPLYPEGTFSKRSEDLRADADRIDRDEQNMVDIYVARTGKPEADVRELIKVDRFMTATEALVFGFCDVVNPLKGKAPAAAAVQARLKILKQAVARADKRVMALRTAKPKPKTAARAASTPRPMATTSKKPATKPAVQNRSSLSAAQKTAAQAVAALAKQLGVKATIEGVDEGTEAVAEATKLKDQEASLYTDGPLAEGSEVFNDEAMTMATDDGTYEAEDGREIVVAGGVVDSVTESQAAGEEEEAPAADAAETITAAINAALAPMVKRMDGLEASFNKAVPTRPRPVTSSQVPDAKTGKPKTKGVLAGASVQR